MNFQAFNKQRKFILIMAVAGLIAMFLPWVTVSAADLFNSGGDNGLGGSSNIADSLFDKSAMNNGMNGMHGAGVVVFLAFLCSIALSLLGDQLKALDKTNWLLAIAAGAAALLFTIVMLANTPTGSLGFVKSSVGWGAWVALLASAGVIGSAWMFKNPEDNIKDSFDKLKKGLSVLVLIAGSSLLFAGCSKSNAASNTSTGGVNQWTLKGTTYKGLSSRYDDTSSALAILTSADAGGNLISVIFYSHPSASGTYTVTNGGISSAGAYCLIQEFVYANNTSTIYSSTGKTGDMLNITITGGKLKVSFTNVTMSDNTTTTTSSGTVAQQ
jgi:hypothetical protein